MTRSSRRRSALASLAVLAMAAASAGDVGAESNVHACIAASTRAQTLRQDGHLLDAREQLIACARDACPAVVRAQCAKWLGEVEARIPSVVVRAQNAAGDDLLEGADLRIDGVEHPLDGHAVRLDPGEHTFTLQTSTGARKEERALLVEGETSRIVTLHLPGPAPSSGAAPASSTRTSDATSSTTSPRTIPIGAWITGGAGLLALGGATYFGLAAKSQLDGLQGSCSPHCENSQTQTGRSDALAFDVLLGVGGAAVAAALVWAWVAPASHDAAPAAWLPDVRPVARGALATWTLRYGY